MKLWASCGVSWLDIDMFIIWASTPENLSSGVCEQQRCRPACAFAQSGQLLCNYFVIGPVQIKKIWVAIQHI